MLISSSVAFSVLSAGWTRAHSSGTFRASTPLARPQCQRRTMSVPVSGGSTAFCRACGRPMDPKSVMCINCGVMQDGGGLQTEGAMLRSDKRILPAALLCFFVGVFGAHRFYVGKIGTGLLQLFTIGGLGIWWLIDMILILTGSFRDGDGRKIDVWT
jgi:TM2 domain-containing membrane protein YozV